MGQVPPKWFLAPAPYGSSEAATPVNPVQPAAVSPQMPMLPPNFQDPGTMAQGTTSQLFNTPLTGGGGGYNPVGLPLFKLGGLLG